MKKVRCLLGAIILVLMLAVGSQARAQASPDSSLWQEVESVPQGRAPWKAWIQPQVFRAFKLQHAAFRPLLDRAPKEAAQPVNLSEAIVFLPMPDGTLARFRFVESPVMAPELASKFPEIKTYLGRGIDDPGARVRFDLTPAGFHAQILSPHGAVYIDPYLRGDTNLHVVYYKHDYLGAAPDFHCLSPEPESAASPSAPAKPLVVSSDTLRTYRLACAATAEYTAYFGGTVTAGLAAIVTAINRVTGVYESEVAIRLVLVANNNLIAYTNSASEPYSNGDPSTLLAQNQANLDAVIGSANYDIGHVFSTAGGGLAAIGVACVSGLKAQGETGIYPPVGDAFYIDYVAHEIGHQFGAFHTFNSSAGACGYGNRCGPSAFEPGSGSTIMAYAGICGADNLQPHSDPYFHSASLEQILAYTSTGAGSSCPVLGATANTAPTVNAGPDFTIPIGTPFTLTASGSDTDGNALTYDWEERDLGPATTLTAPDDGSSPMFRSFAPTNSPSRSFPRLSDILDNLTTPGEMLPAISRTLHFRVTARDNGTGGGSINTADVQITVANNAGPFVVNSPSAAVTWSGLQTVTWNVAGTASLPVNVTNVIILLSTDGGLSFPYLLASNAPNAGSQSVLLPAVTTSSARIKVQAAANIFFAVSPGNFSLVAPGSPSPPALAFIADQIVHAGSLVTLTTSASEPGATGGALLFSLDPGAPPGAAIDANTGVFSWPTCSSNAGTTNRITVRVSNSSSTNLSAAESFTVTVVPPPTLQLLRLANGLARITWSALPGQAYHVQYKQFLTDTNWSNLSPAITAAGFTAALTDPLATTGQRFYRVVLGF